MKILNPADAGIATGDALAALHATLPPGAELALFVVADAGDSFESVFASTMDPMALLPVLRHFIERVENGRVGKYDVAL